MTGPRTSHRLFAATYDRLTAPLERSVLAPRRAALFADLGGDVLEIGAGTGASLGHYPAGVRLVAAEPDAAMRRRLRRAVERQPAGPEVCAAAAEDLPFPDGRFAAVVSTCVLCSVADPERALAEVHRVLRTGGRLVVLEHVRGTGRIARWQDLLTPVWSRLAGGCHPNRDLPGMVERAGFAFVRRADFDPMPRLVITRPMVAGIAVRQP